MIETDTDRLEMLKALGETVYIDGRPVSGVFENPFEELELERELDGASYSLTVRTSDIPSLVRGDNVLRGTTTYSVVRIQPDGEGMTTLRLSE